MKKVTAHVMRYSNANRTGLQLNLKKNEMKNNTTVYKSRKSQTERNESREQGARSMNHEKLSNYHVDTTDVIETKTNAIHNVLRPRTESSAY